MIFQIGSALLDACVLSVLEREDMYGYILTQNVKEVVDISESTLYPVLRRLQKEAYLVTYDQPFAGRNRRPHYPYLVFHTLVKGLDTFSHPT